MHISNFRVKTILTYLCCLIFIVGYANSIEKPINYLVIAEKNIQDSYVSPKYGYTINLPDGFEKKVSSIKNIDLKLVNAEGSSILVNVSPRLKDEYSISAHDYTAKMFQDGISKTNPSFKIVKSEKIYIDGERAFIMYYTDNSPLRSIECHIFVKDNVFVITATSKKEVYTTYETRFLQTIKSLKFKK